MPWLLSLVLAVGALLVPARATAQPSELEPGASGMATSEQEPLAKKNKKKPKLKWGGRVFVGDLLSRQRIAGDVFWRNNHSVSSARVGMSYKHPEGVKAVIKLEFEDGKPDLKDAYVRLDLYEGLDLQAGRFKRQMSSVALASKWDLPSIERGLLSTLDVDGLPFSGGRGDGARLRYELPTALSPMMSASVYSSSLGSGVALDPSDHLAEDFYLRGSIEPAKGLQLASSMAFIGYLDTVGDTESFDHAPMASLELSYMGKHLDAWVEGFYGRSLIVSIQDAQIDGRFWAARALVAPRFRTGTPRRLIPFLGASYLDPRTNKGRDANSEVQAGANLAFSKIWRLQLEVSQSFAQGDFSPAIEGTAFRIQLGANFKE